MAKYLDATGVTYLWAKIKSYIAGVSAWTKDGTDSAPGVVFGSRQYKSTVGKYSVINGYGCIASEAYAHAEGSYSSASGKSSHAEGNSNAQGVYSHAEGYGYAQGECSHAEGGEVYAVGACSHAEGVFTSSNGQRSHAEGESTTASGNASHTEGYGTKTSGSFSHAEGRYNVDNANALHSRGVGTGDTARKNSEYTYFNASDTSDTKNGNIYFLGVGGYDGMSTDITTYKSVQAVIADFEQRIAALEAKIATYESSNS